MLYCTRRNVHVDRCASAWLIVRFIDAEATFVFVDEEHISDNAIPFDMLGVAWGHQGNRCSFEVIAELHGLDDPVVAQIARIVHGADITADADETLESAGVDLIFRGLRLVSSSDDETFERGFVVLDAMYAALKAQTLR